MTALLTAEERRDIEERAWIRRKCPVCEGVIDLTRACAQCANRGHIYVVHEDTGALLAHIKELTREWDEAQDKNSENVLLASGRITDALQQCSLANERAERAEARVKELTKALEEAQNRSAGNAY